MEDTLNNNNTSSTTPPLDSSQYENTSLSPEDLDSMWLRWKCLKCGYVYEGINELKVCPRCGNENPDLFEDSD